MPPKTTKSAGPSNRLPKTSASSKVGLGRRREGNKSAPANASNRNQRSRETIQRLQMYKDTAIRNKKGKIVGGSFMMKDRAGDTEITAATGRIQPDRRWFGNTRVVNPKQLDDFRKNMTESLADPYSVVLKRKHVPLGLLREAAEYSAQHNNRTAALLEQEPFEQVFGKGAQRKRVKLDQLLIGRSNVEQQDDGDEVKADSSNNVIPLVEGQSNSVPQSEILADDNTGYAALLKVAQDSLSTYETVNTRQGIVPWGRDSNLDKTEGEGVDWRHLVKDDLFLKGQSKRIWGEFYKVVDCSDVVLHVIDARNVPGTRCTMIERHITKNAPHKHLVFILNKIDLVPNWVAKRWMGELSKSRPTIAFHASLTQAFGKGALISLLRQFGKLHEDKKQISCGIVGYPNVGKSSVINTLISKKSCKVAPIPGETKIWQYVTLFKRISLIDCPGVVVDTAGDTEEDSVLKGVVRSERLETPEDFVAAIIARVNREYINAQYKIEKSTWTTDIELMEAIAIKCGRLRKKGDPCLRSAAVMLINDFQRGRLPHYVPPPELKTDDDNDNNIPSAVATTTTTTKSITVDQDLDKIGLENMEERQSDEQVEEDAKELEE